ncbi:GntR family transcriptional regulator [Klebsiella pneumoniae]|uniref:GntR family transcriptional regulator n=1 Tax=Klebsiella pneumoniae TaxID=573 RepID=A0A378F545_KLEPN|nr:GntR family transcriptional regulator [Klebsiella pneumoniae]
MKKYQTVGAATDRADRPWRLVAWRSAAVAARAGDQQRHELYDRQPCLSAAGKPGAHRRPSAVGYYVAPQPVKLRQPAPPAQVTRDEAVDINTYIFEVLQASRQASMLPFASAFPDPRLFPLQQLNRSLAQVSKTATAMSVIENLPPGQCRTPACHCPSLCPAGDERLARTRSSSPPGRWRRLTSACRR